MTALFSSRWGWRLAGLACFTLCLALLSGCDAEPYSADLEYPARTDVVVIDVDKKNNLPYVDQPGEFTHFFNNLKALADLDPTGKKSDGELPANLARLKQEGFRSVDPELVPANIKGPFSRWQRNTFGKPALPLVRIDEEKDPSGAALLEALHLHDDKQLALGSLLYRRHCVHCHGVSGDGRGPTAPWVNPHPRDYRAGLFKFSSSEGEKPRRADLKRTLYEGIESTSMPSFKLLKDEELEALVSYVMHLSIRGEVEYQLVKAVLAENALTEEEVKEQKNIWKTKEGMGVNDTFRRILETWDTSDKTPIKVEPYPAELANAKPGDPAMQESIIHGYSLFLSAGCIACHNDYGRQIGFYYDKWGTMVRPANLTTGIYRGGRRPVDIYYRIHGGINGSGMAASTTLRGNQKDMWDLVNFVQAIPYPGMLPKNDDPKSPRDIRGKIYGHNR